MEQTDFYSAVKKASDNKPKETLIDVLLGNGCILESWVHRYGGYIWVALVPYYHFRLLEDARDFTESADIESAGFCEYVQGAGGWLPFESGETVTAALNNLCKKLDSFNENNLQMGSKYWDKVEETFKQLEAVSDGGYGIATAIDTKLLSSIDAKKVVGE